MTARTMEAESDAMKTVLALFNCKDVNKEGKQHMVSHVVSTTKVQLFHGSMRRSV